MAYSIETTQYREAFERRIRTVTGLDADLSNPVTIQEKIAWLAIYDANPLKTICADKVRVHEYVTETLGTDICVPIISTYQSPAEIDPAALPDRFVLKCNHGSGMNIIVPHKSSLDWDSARRRLSAWLSVDFSFRNSFELQYHDIPRLVLAEEYVDDGTPSLRDYKFWCFNGEPRLYTINDGNGHGDIMYYRMDGTPFNLYGVPDPGRSRPSGFDLMAEYARKLSAPFRFVRCDFYQTPDTVLLGELTFTPGACLFRYARPEYETEVGSMLQL